MTTDNSKEYPEVVVMYFHNDEDTGDILFTPEEFEDIFQFKPKESEYYVLKLYSHNTEEDNPEGDVADLPEGED